MRRREFIAGLGSAAAWPAVARAQQGGRMRRIGILLSAVAADDPQRRMGAFVQRLAELGWTEGRDLRIDYRYGLADPDRLRRYAGELVALSSDVLLAAGNRALAALQEATRILPIVFANVVDPVGAGLVASLAHPGGNATGFMTFEFGLSTKWLELLKQIAPHVRRVGVLRAPDLGSAIGQFVAMQALAPSLGIEVSALEVRDAGDIEHAITGFAQSADVGLIVALSVVANRGACRVPIRSLRSPPGTDCPRFTHHAATSPAVD
jgi:putative ABC transport system substrate-binding protein